MQAADFDAFYVATSPRLVRQVYLMVGSLPEAEDVAHEAYERAWLHWRKVAELDSPEAWVRTVARRLAVSRWRRTRNAATAWRRRADGDTSDPPSDDHLALVAALRQLPERQRVAIVLHHLADLTVEQVAAETGASSSAVKAQLVRGRTALAELLGSSDLTSLGGTPR